MKRLLLITLLVFSLKSFALEISCKENQLNNMIYRSLVSYIDRNNEFISKTYGVHGGITYYICASGLPYCYFIDDFYAKLSNVKYFSLDNADNSKWLKKMIKKGFRGLFVDVRMHKLRITITVSERVVKKVKGDIATIISDWGIYEYIYSQENDDWILSNTQYGGV